MPHKDPAARRAYTKAYRESHKEELSAKKKAYAQAHKAAKSEYDAKYYAARREQKLAYQRDYKRKHPDKIKAYRDAKKEEYRQKRRIYDATHPDIIKRNNDKKRHEITCKQCGNSAIVYFGEFCSVGCRGKWFSGPRSPGWRGGISFEPYCEKFNNNLKERVRAFFEYRCILCGKHTKDNTHGKRAINSGWKLSVHHVEYNKKACCDGAPVHFAALCHNCHAKTSSGDRQRWEDMLHRVIEEVYGGRSYFTKDEYEARTRSATAAATAAGTCVQ